MGIAPVIIIGCPRSGTTLLSQLLEPTKYGGPVETHFITKFYKRLETFGDLSLKKNTLRLLKHILSERPVKQWRLSVDFDAFWGSLTSHQYREIVDKLMMLRSRVRGKESWGEKTPHYTLDLDILYSLYPEAKYLYIVRDGRDVALSLLRKPWGPSNIYSCAELWRVYNRNTPTLDLLLRSGKALQVRYEDLITKPGDSVREIYEFLGEEYGEERLSPLLQSIMSANFDKWKRKLKRRQIEVFEGAAGCTLARLGYETSPRPRMINPVARWFWKLHNQVRFCKNIVKMNTVDVVRIKLFNMEPFAE